MVSAELQRSLDELARASLQGERNEYFHWLFFWTAVVALGVALEIIELIPFRKVQVNVSTGMLVARRRLILLVKRIEIFAWMLLVAALIGEGVCEALVSTADGVLQTFNNTLLTEANDRASANEKEAAGLRLSLETEKSARARLKGDLDKAVAEGRQKAAEQEQRNLASQKQLGVEQDKRLELEKSLAPRKLPFTRYTDGTTNIEGMMSKAGMSVIIEYIQDAEAARAAGNIAFLFKQAKWKILAYNPTLEPIFDGVFVESYFPSLDDLSASKVEAWQRSSDICALVVRDLLENNWKASPKPGLPGKLTPELIRVQVGLKPFPYFQNEATKQDQVSLEKFVGVNRHRNDGKEIESSIVPGPGPNLVDSFTIRQSPPPKQDHN